MKKNSTLYITLFIYAIATVSCSKDPELSGNLSSEITVTTQAVSSIAQTTAVSGVQVSAGFSDDVLDKGICWSTTDNPTTALNKLSGGKGSGTSSLILNGLTPGSVYYLRAYVTTKNEAIYGNQQQFRTFNYQLATLTLSPVANITQTTAICGGNVTYLGGGVVSAKGVCWSTTSVPTIVNPHTLDGSGLGTYSSAITGLNPSTTYYVRAYATNQAGTAYSPLLIFTTTSVQPATVSSVTVSGITKNTATISGSVTADGGGPITSRGICWSIGSIPYVPQNYYNSNGSGTGAVSATLTGLVSGTTYYVRAYATNAAGTSYGALVSFRTL